MSPVDFRVVRRGYDPDEVNRAIAQRDDQLARAKAELARIVDDAANSSGEGAQKDKQIADLMGRIDMLEETLAEARQAQPKSPTFDDLGARVAEILNLASDEADDIVEQSREEAAKLLEEAKEKASNIAADAKAKAEKTVKKANAEAEHTMQVATEEAEEILEQAKADAATRREEAEGIYEAQRAKAAQAAADFEQSMAARRAEAVEELDATISKKRQEIEVAEERVIAANTEADETLRLANQQADQLVRDAENQANSMIVEAKSRAERSRQNAEREVAAATARRDSITAQLANVRQMLATLSDPQAAMGEVPRTAKEWVGEPGEDGLDILPVETVEEVPSGRKASQ
ncbi:hypothetical protein HMPREF1531_01097 [Propionibacterium sp. oral taxon 192 str. F0372]|uniref:hypothetical protein n=1 Tax=Propionibacterium sp. oral taxon 192 TaxID=671222 RepID=UPI0003548944|nr:hypothetical protein [Propionibacterium sp. oral taxon 192]EPH04383.1 hypothetical protein HMPREF1531_01097 [Propionibacterium sp. oral taxon 192 str. F0372]